MKSLFLKISVYLDTLVILLSLFSLFTLSGCTTLPLVNDKSLNQSNQKVSVISTYLNKKFYEINRPPADSGGLELIENDFGLGLEEHALSPSEVAARQKLVNEVSDYFIEQINKRQPFTTLTSKATTQLPNYSQPIKTDLFHQEFRFDESSLIKKKNYLQANGLKLITFKELIQETKGEELPIGEIITLKDLGNFAKKIGVDAIAILELDLGYKYYSNLDSKRIKIRASTSVKLLVVHQSGRVIFETQDIIKGGGNRQQSSIIKAKKDENHNFFIFKENSEIFRGYLEALKKNLDEIINSFN